jgi:cytoskeletal protein CcmA (bactofilin family)
MFKQGNKTKKDLNKVVENGSKTETTKVSNTVVEGENLSHNSITSSKIEKTIIGEKITIEGSIRSEENLTIEGLMKGNVEMEKYNFGVGSKGRVEGEIRAHDVTISGLLHGKVKALGKVEITKEADFYGSIKANSISIEDGAFFKGEIELGREPHRKNDPVDKQMNGTGSKRSQVSNLPPVEASKEK